MRLTQRQVDYCMECGVCTGSCPVSHEHIGFSPRQTIKRAMAGLGDGLLEDRRIWACLSCAQCSARCPAQIDFPEFNRCLREKAHKAGHSPRESHHGVLQTIARLQTCRIEQNRIAWAEEAGRFASTGDYYFFVGCLPYFEVTFRYLAVSPLDTARSVLALLNRLGIEPVVSNAERCCGHDALWCGDKERFKVLAQLNLEAIEASGAKTVLFSCPEGYFTFARHYPEYFGTLPFAVCHVSALLAKELPASNLSFLPTDKGKMTFHDPCRLGRLAGLYDPPRQILDLIPGTCLTEMAHTRENALCCGTSAWMECSGCAKAMQVKRLQEAARTGARTLVTACPKCLIHLTCARGNGKPDLNIVDLYTVLADCLEGGRQP